MKRPFLEARFYETYYFATAVRNILHDRFAYLRDLDGFFCDDSYLQYVQPFPRFSAFHSFVRFVIEDVVRVGDSEVDLRGRQQRLQQFSKFPEALEPHPTELPINEALKFYDIRHTSFDEWLEGRDVEFLNATDDDVYDYHQDLRLEGPIEELVKRFVAEVFFVLFQNRGVLLLFNDMMADLIAETELTTVPAEYRKYFVRSGVLRRAPIPKWVRRAVYFRDRGMCVRCYADLSGTLRVSSAENFDHIVPLASGGLNDVTNVQLLCQACNSRKRQGEPVTSNVYEAWYPADDAEDLGYQA